jgi:hypothetical protein
VRAIPHILSKEDFVPVPNPDDHLGRLLIEPGKGVWLSSLYLSLKELISPPQLPPLELTSKPVQVQDIWGSTDAASGLACGLLRCTSR